MKYILLFCLSHTLLSLFAQKENTFNKVPAFEKFTLSNGLTVYLVNNENYVTTYASVVCKVGATDDPEDMPGMAHCLEHMLFKGTSEMGTTNWISEKPHYKKLVSLYRQLDSTKNLYEISKIRTRIDSVSKIADKYIVNGEVMSLTKNLSTNINALTYFDYTNYYNVLSPDMLEKWMKLYSHRFINPVFRGFVRELDVLSNEYYLRSTNNTSLYDKFNEHILHLPSAFSIQNQIKKISLARLIDFYYKYYVANNMSVILVGSFDVAVVKPMLEKYFGAISSSSIAIQHQKLVPDLTRKKIKGAYSDKQRSRFVYFNTIPMNHPDLYTLQLCVNLLTNTRVGMLEKLKTERKISDYQSVNYYTSNFGVTSFKLRKLSFFEYPVVKTKLIREISELKTGNFSDTLFETIKKDVVRNFTRNLESPANVASFLIDLYVYDLDKSSYLSFPEKFQSISKDDIMRVAKQNFSQQPVVFYSKLSLSRKKINEEYQHNEIDKTSPTQKSKFALQFDSIKRMELPVKYIDFRSVIDTTIAKGLTLSCSANPANSIFVLKLIFKPSDYLKKIIDYQYAFNFQNLSIANATVFEFAKKQVQLQCKHSFRGYELTIEGYDKDFQDIMSLYSSLLHSPNINKSGKIQSRKHYWLRFWKNQYITSDSLASIVSAVNHSLSEIEYNGTLPVNEVVGALTNQLNCIPLSVERNKKNPNSLEYNKEKNYTKIYYSFSGTICGTTDRVKLLLANEYYKLAYSYFAVSQLCLASQVNATVTYPKVDSGVPAFRIVFSVSNKNCIELATQLASFQQLSVDSVIWLRAKYSLNNLLMNNFSSERAQIENAQKLKKNGTFQFSIANDLDELEKLTFNDFKTFYNERLTLKPFDMVLNCSLTKSEKLIFDNLKKQYEKN